MQYCHSIFASLLKPIPRRWFKTTVERHGRGAAYDKSFGGGTISSCSRSPSFAALRACADRGRHGTSFASSLSSRDRSGGSLDAVGCQCAPADRNLRGDLRRALRLGGSCVEAGGCRDVAAHRFDPNPARGGRALGRVEWAHAVVKLHGRLRSLADHPQRIEIRPRPSTMSRSARRCRSRRVQPMSSTRPIAITHGGRGFTRPAAPSSRAAKPTPPTSLFAGARSRKKKGRRHGPRRRQRQTRNPGPYQARHIDASRAREARGRYGHHPHHQ